MDKKLLNIFSLRLEFIEKTLAFFGMDEQLNELHEDIGRALRRYPNEIASGLEGVLNAWETRLFDNPKVISLSLNERLHHLLKGLVK